mgnify:CR=1 FL=1
MPEEYIDKLKANPLLKIKHIAKVREILESNELK